MNYRFNHLYNIDNYEHVKNELMNLLKKYYETN